MAFTTWAALKQEMLDDLASGRWKMKSYTVGDISRTFVSTDEFLKVLDRVTTEASQEGASGQPCIGRTYAKQGGGGRW